MSGGGSQIITNMPEGYRPRSVVYNRGIGTNAGIFTAIAVQHSGVVSVDVREGTYVGADIEYDVFS